MSDHFRIEHIEPTLNLLGQIAENYDEGSDEYQALYTAANALFFVWKRRINDEFCKFLCEIEGELTEKQIEFLKGIGVYEEPDSP